MAINCLYPFKTIHGQDRGQDQGLEILRAGLVFACNRYHFQVSTGPSLGKRFWQTLTTLAFIMQERAFQATTVPCMGSQTVFNTRS